jgi:hypothetical protein
MSALTITAAGSAPRASGRRHRRRARGPLAAALVAATAFASGASVAEAKLDPPTVPAKIAVQDGHKLFLVGHAVGVQIYSCNATADGFAWGLVVPRANLYGDNGKLIATHYGGPTWEARDGSKAVGSVVERVKVAGTIDWLLLATTSSPGADGDRLAGTTFIQRVATTGGVAPAAASCNLSTVGTREEIAYTADYYFWRAKGA